MASEKGNDWKCLGTQGDMSVLVFHPRYSLAVFLFLGALQMGRDIAMTVRLLLVICMWSQSPFFYIGLENSNFRSDWLSLLNHVCILIALIFPSREFDRNKWFLLERDLYSWDHFTDQCGLRIVACAIFFASLFMPSVDSVLLLNIPQNQDLPVENREMSQPIKVCASEIQYLSWIHPKPCKCERKEATSQSCPTPESCSYPSY